MFVIIYSEFLVVSVKDSVLVIEILTVYGHYVILVETSAVVGSGLGNEVFCLACLETDSPAQQLLLLRAELFQPLLS